MEDLVKNEVSSEPEDEPAEKVGGPRRVGGVPKKDVVLRLDNELAEKVEAYRAELSKQQGKEVTRTFALVKLLEAGLGTPAFCLSDVSHEPVEIKPAPVAKYVAPSGNVQIFCPFGHDHPVLSEALNCGRRS